MFSQSDAKHESRYFTASAIKTFQPPHKYSSSIALQCVEILMRLTHNYPNLMRKLIYLGGVGSIALLVAPRLLSTRGRTISNKIMLFTSILGLTGGIVSLLAAYTQHRVLGFPLENDTASYQNKKFQYNNAQAELVIKKNHFPLLRIKATNHYDAGYVEGYILGKAMHASLASLRPVYTVIRRLLGAPQYDDAEKLRKHLNDIIKIIPENYLEEMRGKVAGYNQWLKKHDSKGIPLIFEFYLLLQLQPDIHNYRPLPLRILGFDLGCTTIAFRLKDYTFFTRVLDWPSFGIANYFLQVERTIRDCKKTSDIGFPLATGLLTAVNENGVLIQINVAHGDVVQKAQGMPALFFNRYCAERIETVKDVYEILKQKKPLSAYHMMVTNGESTKAFHFYQSLHEKNAHTDEELSSTKAAPALLVVANSGVQIIKDKVQIYNYKDSQQRRENVNAFFSQLKLQPYIDKQKDDKKLSSEDITQLEEIALQIARLALINNCGSTLCAIYVFYKDKIIDARAAVDNHFAPDKPLIAFKKLN